jgi:glycine cleavage system aminomethyltransferase T
MTLEFLRPDAALITDSFSPVARSPMERRAHSAGARFEIREGWNLAVAYSSSEIEAEACRESVAWADVSHLGKLELQASPGDLEAMVANASGGGSLELGRATRAAGAWWCPLTRTRALVICDPGRLAALREPLIEGAARTNEPASIVEVTTIYAALTLIGPLAREVFARFSAIDLRPQVSPVAALRPGSIGRQPGIVVHEARDRYLLLFGWAIAEYMWATVEDAGLHLGGRPVGVDALAPLEEPLQEMRSHA